LCGIQTRVRFIPTFKWNGNFQAKMFENLGIPHEVVLFFGSYAKLQFSTRYQLKHLIFGQNDLRFVSVFGLMTAGKIFLILPVKFARFSRIPRLEKLNPALKMSVRPFQGLQRYSDRDVTREPILRKPCKFSGPDRE